jgi:hypothetical protein
MPRAGIEPATCPLGGGRAIHCATEAGYGNLEGCYHLLPRVGLEPTRSCPHRILSPARLPVPPPRQTITAQVYQANFFGQ